MNPSGSIWGKRCGTPRVCAWVAVAALQMGATAPLSAQNVADREQVAQKLELTERLFSDASASARISGSGNQAAVGHLDEGRVHHALAADLLKRGDVEGARREVDIALQHLGKARRMVPDTSIRKAAARSRHDLLLGSTERLIDAWRERAGPQMQAHGNDLTAALGLIDVARRLAREGRYEESNQTLTQAERHVLTGMNRTLHAVTLDYTLRASNPAEEFEQELARRRGFAELLPLAVRDLNPKPDALALIDRYAEASNAMQIQALEQRRVGNSERALVLIRNATLYLQRALLATGLVAPQPVASVP